MSKVFRWLGLGAGVVALILIVVILVTSARGRSALRQTFDVSTVLTTVPADSLAIAAGEHLAQIHACGVCHGENLAGTVLLDAPPFRVVATNLTRGAGGIGSTFQVADWDRVIRHGVRSNGTPLLPIMPSANAYHNLSDADAARLIAYLEQLPPVDNELPPSRLKLLGQILAGLGAVDLAGEVDISPARSQMPEPGATPAYGRYLATITCKACHGEDFRGGPPLDPSSPPAPGLTTIGAWDPVDFDRAIRQGIAPDGRQYHDAMPYEAFRFMYDQEVEALRLFLSSLMDGAETTTPP